MNLGCGQTVRAMPIPSSSVSLNPGDGVSDEFPVGLRVLVVDDDPTCLRILEKMLRNCLYEVTKCNRAEFALSLLRENRNGYDVVISDVHMPDMDGFKLLEHVGLEMDLPVIMMSADDSKSVVMKGVTHGACDYLIKPVRMEALKNIWQHVVRKKKHEWKDRDNNKEIEQSGSVEDGDHRQQRPPCEDVDYSSSANEGNWKNSKRRKDEEDDTEDRDDSSSLKKPRVVWSVELHQQFVAAVNQLGIDKAVPKRILELMNVPGLTRENVASHLQKYRLYLRRLSGVSQHQSVLNNPFIGPSDAAAASFGSLSSLNGLDLQALAASGQIPPQSLATLQAAALGRSASKSGISCMPVLDQRNIFSFESPKFNNSNKQMNLLHGIPTNMEAKQLANLPFSQVTQSSSLLMQMPKGVVGSTTLYNPVVSQTSSMVDFSGMSSFPSKTILQQEVVNSDMKGSRNFIPGYELFNEIHQHKPQDWNTSTFHVSQQSSVQSNIDVVPQSVMIRGQNTNNHPVFSGGETVHSQSNSSNTGQQLNPFIVDNSFRVKAETHNTLFQQQFGQEDLMSALLKQQQEGIGPVDNEFGFDGYSLDNLPV